MIGETYIELLTDPAHIMFELTLMLIFDVLIGMLAWPMFRKWLAAHDLRHHGHTCEDDHEEGD